LLPRALQEAAAQRRLFAIVAPYSAGICLAAMGRVDSVQKTASLAA